MKIKDGFVLKAIAGSYMVVPLGSQVSQFGSIIKLTETGAFLWDKLSENVEKSELVTALTNEYDVDEARASADIDKFIEKLKIADLLV
ncbi:MAG: PqqD family protein [Ruminococcus sp.]|nr:PqqD family protein [Ruminococcus sp.]